MGFFDKFKASGGHLKEKVENKVEHVQGTRKAAALLEDLGRLLYVERTGRGIPGADAEIQRLVAELQQLEAGGVPIAPPVAARPPSEARMAPQELPVGALHPELSSRVLAATAHADHRTIRRRDRLAEHGTDEYDVYALCGDRFVWMVLSLRPDGSVAEATHTFVDHEITDVAVHGEHGMVDVDSPSGPHRIAVPLDVAEALMAKRRGPGV